MWVCHQALGFGTKNLEMLHHKSSPASAFVYWRVEGSLLDLTTVRPVAFFTWNAQTFLERWVRRGLGFFFGAARPFLYPAHPGCVPPEGQTMARGGGRARLDVFGE